MAFQADVSSTQKEAVSESAEAAYVKHDAIKTGPCTHVGFLRPRPLRRDAIHASVNCSSDVILWSRSSRAFRKGTAALSSRRLPPRKSSERRRWLTRQAPKQARRIKNVPPLDWSREVSFSRSSSFERVSSLKCCIKTSPPTGTPRKMDPEVSEIRGSCCRLYATARCSQ